MDLKQSIIILSMLILAALFTVLERKVSWFKNKGLSNGNL